MLAVATIAVAGALAGPMGSSLAGPPGKWSQVTSEPQSSNTREIGLERTADGVLHVLWTRDNGPTEQVLHSAIPLSAIGLQGPHQLASTANAVNDSVDLLPGPGGGLRALFAGIFPGSPLPGGYNTVMATSTSPASGTTWTSPVAASNNQSGTNSPVYAAGGIGGAVGGGFPVVSTWGDSSPSGGGVHFGLNPLDPDLPYPSSCCQRDPNVGIDAFNGDVVLAMIQIGSAGDGIRIAGNVPAQKAPGSDAAWLQQRVGISGRIGAGGVYLAYGHGTNPFNARPALWRVGTPAAKVIPQPPDAEHTTLAPAPGGRLWVAWEGKDRGKRLFATRTNPAATKFGRIVSIKPPKGTQVIYRLNVEGSRGFLDLLALVGRGGSDIAYWHQRLLPGLTLTAKPKKVKRGKRVTFRVLDAGAPVKGAKVVLRLGKLKRTRVTNAQGRAKIRVPKGTKRKRGAATARKAGYTVARRGIRIRK